MGYPKYAELCTIFGASVATATLHYTSIEPTPTSDDERHLDAALQCWAPLLGIEASLLFHFDSMSQYSMDLGIPSLGPSSRTS